MFKRLQRVVSSVVILRTYLHSYHFKCIFKNTLFLAFRFVLLPLHSLITTSAVVSAQNIDNQTWIFGDTIKTGMHGAFDLNLRYLEGRFELLLKDQDRQTQVLRFDDSFKLVDQIDFKDNSNLMKEDLFVHTTDSALIRMYVGSYTLISKSLTMTVTDLFGGAERTIQISELPNKNVQPEDLHFFVDQQQLIVWYEWHQMREKTKRVSVIGIDLETFETTPSVQELPVESELFEISHLAFEQHRALFFGLLREPLLLPRNRERQQQQYVCFASHPVSSNLQKISLGSPGHYHSGLRVKQSDGLIYLAFFSSDKRIVFKDTIHLMAFNPVTLESQVLIRHAIRKIEPRPGHGFKKGLLQHPINLWVDHIDGTNNEFMLILEFYQLNIIGGVGTRSLKTHRHGPVVVIKIDAQNPLECNARMIDKLQISENAFAINSSYFVYRDEKGLCLLYNEIPKGKKARNFLGNRRTIDHSSNLMQCLEVNSNSIECRIVQEQPKGSLLPAIGDALILKNGDVVIPFWKGEYISLAKYRSSLARP